jgi:prepilin-type N-terminal cleavage/methylation domain-containing protein
MKPGGEDRMSARMKEIMCTRRSQRGFTLLEILVVAVIITILVGAGTVAFLEVERRTKEKLCATKLQEIAAYQKFYARDFGEYADFEQLQEEGFIDPNYVADDNMTHTNGPAFVPDYILEFVIPGDGTYRIDAYSVMEDAADFSPRWRLIGGTWDLRPMYVDDRGVVRWVEDNRPIF